MLSLARLLYTKAPSTQGLLDIALILALVPHLFALKAFIIIYLLIAVFFIRKEHPKKYDTMILFSIGAVLIVISFFNTYNFSDFSRMQFFVSLVSSLLILAATLQRVTKQINFYLKASPGMLMLLSFFFFDTIAMLFYSLFVFFVFVLLSIWSRMDAPLATLIKFNTALFALSLPAVVVLFIAFPRISFEKADFGFRAEGYSSSEYDGSMYVSDKPFIPSNKVVMEIFFEEQVPAEEKLYFRGSVLYPKDANTWEYQEYRKTEDILKEAQETISYNVIMYPHAKKWLYPLDIPLKDEYKKTQLQKDYTLQASKDLYEKQRYRFESALTYTLLSTTTQDALDINQSAYPKTYDALRSLRVQKIALEQKAYALLEFFQKQDLAYTISPKDLDLKHLVDSFLFEAKNGYCTHFASSFAIAARIVGIPSRVVSGYKADYSSRVENYLVVKQKDAHAWVELYFADKGWVRFEPTATASHNLDLLQENEKLQENKLFTKLNLHYMYVKYLISNWILGFDRLKQLAILESLLNDTIYLLKFLLSLGALIALSLLLFYLLRTTPRKDKLMRVMEKLLRFLEKKGLEKQKNEAMDLFLKRAEKKLKISLKEINTLYHTLKYAKAPDSSSLQKLKEKIAQLDVHNTSAS
jgi:protein-glutamine gamma-glutamyltransferase